MGYVHRMNAWKTLRTCALSHQNPSTEKTSLTKSDKLTVQNYTSFIAYSAFSSGWLFHLHSPY